MLDPKKIILTQIFEGGGGGGDVEVEPLSITENGTYTAETGKAYSPVTANVPNSYAAGDEGKVVSNGALVSQTSTTITENGTVDTTLNNSVTVNVSGGGGASNIVTGTFKGTTADAPMEVSIPYTGSGYPVDVLVYATTPNDVYLIRSIGSLVTWYGVKFNGETPTFTGTGRENALVVSNAYKNSTSSYPNVAGTANIFAYAFYESSPAAGSSADNCVRFKDNNTMSVYIRSASNKGFEPNIEYTYKIIYSS